MPHPEALHAAFGDGRFVVLTAILEHGGRQAIPGVELAD
jgi:hypothetical protein